MPWRSGSDDESSCKQPPAVRCASCGHEIKLQEQEGGGINDLPGLPAGVKFDPTDQEIVEHLEGKAKNCDANSKLHPLIDEFITTIHGDNGICYTHPQKLPGVRKDGQIRHFFHRPSKAYTTGTRKRRKVHTDDEGNETRWHKTGKTRPVFVGGAVKGFKKILVLYTNYGRQRKHEKTNWVMHQYHLGTNEDEKDGEFVVSKVFYQTQPRHCSSTAAAANHHRPDSAAKRNDYFNASNFISFNQNPNNPPQLLPNLVLTADMSSFIRLPSADTTKRKLDRKL